MTPLLAFLQTYLSRRAALVALAIIYAATIVSCAMVIGRLPPEPMRYLDMR